MTLAELLDARLYLFLILHQFFCMIGIPVVVDLTSMQGVIEIG